MGKPTAGRCIVCKKEPDKHHIKTRGSGGSDEERNLLNLCREHHMEIHRIGTTTFVRKHHLESTMVTRGFYLCEISNKWRIPKGG